MKVKYDKKSNTLTIQFREARIKESDEILPNLIADFDYDGKLVRLEILDAQAMVESPNEMLFAIEETATPSSPL